MNSKLVMSLLCLMPTAYVCASVTERLAVASKKTSEIRKNISSGQFKADCSDCRQGCKSCSGCKTSI